MRGRMHKRTHTRTDACTCACKAVPVPMQCSAMCCTATGLPAFEDWGDEAEVLRGIEHLPVPRLGTTGASIWLCPVSQNSIERPVTTTGVSTASVMSGQLPRWRIRKEKSCSNHQQLLTSRAIPIRQQIENLSPKQHRPRLLAIRTCKYDAQAQETTAVGHECLCRQTNTHVSCQVRLNNKPDMLQLNSNTYGSKFRTIAWKRGSHPILRH